MFKRAPERGRRQPAQLHGCGSRRTWGNSEAGLASLRDSLRIAREAAAEEALGSTYNNLSFMLHARRIDTTRPCRWHGKASQLLGEIDSSGSTARSSWEHGTRVVPSGSLGRGGARSTRGCSPHPPGDPGGRTCTPPGTDFACRGDYDEATETSDVAPSCATCASTRWPRSAVSVTTWRCVQESWTARRRPCRTASPRWSVDGQIPALPCAAGAWDRRRDGTSRGGSRAEETAAVEQAMGTGAALLDRMHDLARYSIRRRVAPERRRRRSRGSDGKDAVAWMERRPHGEPSACRTRRPLPPSGRPRWWRHPGPDGWRQPLSCIPPGVMRGAPRGAALVRRSTRSSSGETP